MIKELNELVWYTQQSVWRDEALLSFLCNGKSGILDLYRFLSREHYRTDEEAARAMGIGLSAFKKNGKALHGHLQEMVFFFNEEKAKADLTLKNIFAGAREMAAVRMLTWRTCPRTGRETALRLLRRGLQYDWPEFVVDSALSLRESVIKVGGTVQDFEYYSALYHEYKTYLEWERLSGEYYLRFKIPAGGRVVLNRQKAAQIAVYLGELAPQVGRIPSYFFHLYYFVLRNHYFFQQSDYPGLLENCEAAIVYFRSRSYPVVNPLSIFYYSKVVAHTMLGQYAQGQKDAEESLQILAEGSANWFNALEIYLYLCIHSGEYRRALQIYVQAAGHRRMSSLNATRQENWQILGAYCYILHQLCRINLPDNFPVFKSRKFLNNLPVYSRDKNGMNIAILIAHVLLQLLEGREDEVWERILALERYCARHLRREKDAERIVLFIRILAQLPKASFKQKAFTAKSGPLLEKLRAVPLHVSAQAHELEVIPYENLVLLIGDFLSHREGY